MSERGSFTTEYVYCDKCLDAVKKVLLSDHKFLCSRVIPCWSGGYFPIVAGKIGGFYSGEEVNDMIKKYIPELEKLICHPVRIAVIPDTAEGAILTAKPREIDVDETTTAPTGEGGL